MSNEQVVSFWEWFIQNQYTIINFLKNEDFINLSKLVKPVVDKINPGIKWEFGPGKSKMYSFTLSSGGDKSISTLVKSIIKKSPHVQDWEFYFSRQPRTPPEEIFLDHYEGVIQTNGWIFSAQINHQDNKIDLIIIDEDLAQLEKSIALSAVFIYLDSVLGEESVEKWIGQIGIRANSEGLGKIHQISRLDDYITWAINKNYSLA